jgi:hypothetical protein
MQSVTRDAFAWLEWGRPFAGADIGSVEQNLGAESEALHLKNDIVGAEIATVARNQQIFTR